MTDDLPLISTLIVIAALLAVVLFGIRHICVQDQCHTPRPDWENDV